MDFNGLLVLLQQYILVMPWQFDDHKAFGLFPDLLNSISQNRVGERLF